MWTKRDQYGFFLDGIGKSQIVTEFAFSLNDRPQDLDGDICLFYDKVQPLFLDLKVPILNSLNISKFEGTLITTSLQTTLSAYSIYFTNTPIFYYCYNLEWTYNNKLSAVYKDIFKTDGVKVIARCKDHSNKIFEDFGKESMFVSNTLDIPVFIKKLKEV